jgi:short-subunit dehydrogenase
MAGSPGVVFITGASSGIGQALAREWAQRGADLALAARRVDRLERLAAELASQHARRPLVIPCDVTRDGDLERGVVRTLEAFGRIDVAVANAGFGVVGPVASLTLDDYRRQFETNVFGVLRTVYATLPALRASHGRLAIIGSVSGHLAMPGTSAYAMSKFAVSALARALDLEIYREGVSVTLISPGFVESEIHQVDNRGVFYLEAKNAAPRWLRMRTDRAARKIVRAVTRRRAELVFPGHGKLAVFLQRHFPWLLRGAVRTFGIKGRDEPRRR